MRIRIFTDGACSDNPGPGGWAAVFNADESCNTISGYELQTTNNRMELMAVVKSFEKVLGTKYAKKNRYELYSDSAYVVNAINNHWVEKWQKNGWRTTKDEPIKNKDLWERFIELRNELNNSDVYIAIIKIKGHAGNSFNELVDKLAKEETQIAKSYKVEA